MKTPGVSKSLTTSEGATVTSENSKETTDTSKAPTWSPPDFSPDAKAPPDLSCVLARDSEGNPIFIPTGIPRQSKEELGKPTALMQPGYLVTLNGFRIKATKNLSDNRHWDTNCHGQTIADGKYWIGNPKMQAFLATQMYLARDPVVEKVDIPKNNDIVVWRNNGDVVHSAVITGPGEVTMAAGTRMYGNSKVTTVPISEAWEYPATKEYWRSCCQ